MELDHVIQQIRRWFNENGRDTAVIGISGGKDSTVVAGLCTRALGAAHVVGVLMPNGVQSDLADSHKVARLLGIPYTVMNIAPIMSGMDEVFAHQETYGMDNIVQSKDAIINATARARMMCLYDVAQSLEGRHPCVVGTGNAAEIYVRYFTKWGDGACDFNPIKHAWVHEVIQLGLDVGFPEYLVRKAPADGLSGQTDEERLGFTYEDVYRVATGQPVPPEVEAEIRKRHEAGKHKVEPIPTIE